MTLAAGLRTPGRPGVFLAPAPDLAPLRPERLDVAGFVGVALRGPVDEPVPVRRWSEYVDLFGGFEHGADDSAGGPERLLPHAVSAFFRQGGRLAHVLRVAPHGPGADALTAEQATARLRLPLAGADADLLAADEGSWGTGLEVRLRYEVLQRVTAEAADGPAGDRRRLLLPPGTRAPVGSLLRIADPALPQGVEMRWLDEVDERAPRGARIGVDLDRPLAVPVGTRVAVDVVTGALDVADRSTAGRRGERLTGLGLRPQHPRYVAQVLASGRHLVRPDGDWATLDLAPGTTLSPVTAVRVADGADRHHLVDRSSFFDLGPADADPLDEEPHVGVDRMARVRDLGLLCVPDLGWPDLDGRTPDGLAALEERQQRLVEVARVRHRFVALLDVPLGLSADRVTGWRSSFDSSHAAAYHPWLSVAGPDGLAVPVPPSAFAAGIIAEREHRLGLPWGPANELARDAVRAEAVVTDDIHDRLHELGVNVFRAERDGFRLTAGRTLSSDPDLRQLSVRRLMTMIALSLEHQTQWLAFEPNDAELRERLSTLLTGFLRTLHRQGAFAGRTEAESFFVRCGDDVNPSASQALGRLVAEVGVAPAAPLEYVMVRIARDVDGTLSVVADEAGGTR